MELVAYVSSAEAVRAAVVNGADAVRTGFSGFCPFSSSFTSDGRDFAAVAEYCRIRGVKIYISFGRTLTDIRFNEALNIALKACRDGADAVCSGDIGFLKAIRQLLPRTALHADASVGIHDSSGAAFLASLGISRILLPHQLSGSLLKQIRFRNPESTVELETSCYGQQCIAYQNTCRMSAFTAKPKEGSLCAEPCRESCSLNMGAKSDIGCLRLKSLSLHEHIPELSQLGINAVSVAGAGRRPELTAMAVGIFRKIIDGNKVTPSTEHDIEILNSIFSPSGTTAGFYEGKHGGEMFEDKKQPPHKNRTVLASVRADYMGGDAQRVAVHMLAELRRGMNLRISVTDGSGNTAGADGPPPEAAGYDKRELTPAILKTQLYNTLGTPYICTDARIEADTGLYLPSADISQVRKAALNRLSKMRGHAPEITVGKLPELLKFEGSPGKPDYTFSVLKASQLSPQLAGTKPKVLYIPLNEVKASPASITPFWENGVTSICAVLPPIVSDTNAIEVYRELYSLRELHIDEVMINSLSQLTPAQVLGFKIRGGLNLNVSNSYTLKALKEHGLISAMLSPQLTIDNIREISKCIDTELPFYGRLPLMVTENCIIKDTMGVCSCEGPQNLFDRRGRLHPVIRAEGCRNIIYSPDKLFLANRLRDFENLGLWCLNLSFTTENARECSSVAGRHLLLNKFEPNFKTKGLYYA